VLACGKRYAATCLLGSYGTSGPVGTGLPSFQKGINLAAWVDSQLLMGHMWPQSKTWDPEGVLSTFPALGTAVIGMGIMLILRDVKNKRRTIGLVFMLGVVAVLTGWVWGYWFPINKSMWTSSFVLYTGGWAIIIFLSFYVLLDMKILDSVLTFPLKVFGANALFAYILSVIVAKLLVLPMLSLGAAPHTVLFGWVSAMIKAPYLASLVYAVIFLSLIYLPVWALYRKRVWVKV